MQEQIIHKFIAHRIHTGAKLLLGLSGGPDSMALLYFLIACQKKLNFFLHLAHVNHGWRKESDKEAQILKDLAAQLQLPFHLHKIKEKMGSDLENKCRKERLAFFETLHNQHHFQALLLAHHLDDQAETVLKRVFEGAGLQALGGLHIEKNFKNLSIWRPLLFFKKSELRSYLDKKRITYFEDPTNYNPLYLRSRMRKNIFPEIERKFGKNIQKNCIRLGYLCQELAEYFEEKCQDIENKMLKSSFGDALPLIFPLIELRYFLKRYDKNAHLSSDALQCLLELIQHKKNNCQIQAPPLTFYISGNYLFILKQSFPDFFKEKQRWKVVTYGTWVNFWYGEIAMPKTEVQLESFANLAPPLKRRVKKWYISRCVPSFFHERAPLFMQKKQIVGECLTGDCIKTYLKRSNRSNPSNEKIRRVTCN